MPDPSPDLSESEPSHVYTDGACSGNPGPGGWAWATVDGRQASGGDPDTTNQRMELTAVLRALEAVDGPVTVHSDSTYVVNCFNDRWYEGWLARDWRNSQRKPVANRDLWEPLVELFQKRGDELTFVWVKGHSGDAMNDLVDALAVDEVDKLRPPPTDRTTTTATATVEPDGEPAPWPSERALAATGAAEPTKDAVDELAQVIAGLDPGYDIVVSGLRRGAELAAAELALARRLPLAVVLPFDDPAARWPAAERARFDTCFAQAEWTVVLSGDPAKPGAAVEARNAWIWASVVGVLVVEDPTLADQLDELGLGVILIEAPE